MLREHTDAVYAVAFSGDGTLLASAAADRSVKIWKVDDGVRLYTITEPTDAVLTLAFRPGTRQLAAGGQDKRIRVWEVGDSAARSIRSAPAHRSAVLRVAFSADGRTLASTGTDRDVKMWDAETGQQLRVLSAPRATGRRRWRSVRTAGSWPWAATTAASASTIRCRAGPCSNPSPATRWHDDDDSDTPGCSRAMAALAGLVPVPAEAQTRPAALTSLTPYGIQRGTTATFTADGANLRAPTR